MRLLLLSLLACLIIAHTAKATTWDEPWHEAVMRISDSFVKVKITESQGSIVRADVIKLLAGVRTRQQIELKGYSFLRVLSTSSSSGELRLPFQSGQVYYLFIRKAENTDTYQIPTPTSGWAKVEGGDVHATYRHSYHKAVVPEDVYEKTMQAIFKGIKGQSYDADFIGGFLKEQLTQGVAALKEANPEMTKRFFLQHVALETSYHFGKGADLSVLIPFVDSDSMHVQISACRAVSRIDSPASKEVLMKVIEGNATGFAKVMCVWGLTRLNAKEMIPRLEAFLKMGVDQETGFGGSIMDPRVGTLFPDSVKESVSLLLRVWGRPALNKSLSRLRSSHSTSRRTERASGMRIQFAPRLHRT